MQILLIGATEVAVDGLLDLALERRIETSVFYRRKWV